MVQDNSTNDDRVLILDRFCGREVHPIDRAVWNLYRDDRLNMSNLCVFLTAGLGTCLHEDTETLFAEPAWELDVLVPSLDANSLRPGVKFSVPNHYDESRDGHITNFYYCSHQGTDNNVVEILAVEGSRLLLRLTGDTTDVNYYDGTKAPTRLLVETWFDHDPDCVRSMR